MLKMNLDNSIQLTRGDSAWLEVSIKNGISKEDYALSADDVLRFTIKKSVNDPTALLKKEITGSAVFHILPEDTALLPYGKYMYDVELTTSAGDVYTVIPPTAFKLETEVTW